MDLYTALAYDEGKKLTMYKDHLGYYTIGIGHLLTKENNKAKAIAILDKELGRSTNGTITEAECQKLFAGDIQRTIKGLQENKVTAPVYASFGPIRRAGLENMAFQLGVTGVAGFTNSLKMLLAKDWKRAEANLKLSKWNKQTPSRSNRVINTICYGSWSLYNK